jgi:hypothetical protein
MKRSFFFLLSAAVAQAAPVAQRRRVTQASSLCGKRASSLLDRLMAGSRRAVSGRLEARRPHRLEACVTTLAFGALLVAVPFSTAAAAPPAPSADFDKVIKPFFDQHCVSCHGEKKQKGDFRVDTLKIDFDSPKTMAHWEEIMNRPRLAGLPAHRLRAHALAGAYRKIHGRRRVRAERGARAGRGAEAREDHLDAV